MHVCRVTMSTLVDSATFGLTFNSFVIAKVRAVNAAGKASWAINPDNATIKTKPQKVTPEPVRGNLTS